MPDQYSVSQETTFSASGSGEIIRLIGTGTQYHKITWHAIGSPSSGTVALLASSDGVTFGTTVIAASDCTSNGVSAVFPGVYNYVKVVVASLSGGQVVVTYNGYLDVFGGTVEQVQADWGQVNDTQASFIKNKPTIVDPPVATSQLHLLNLTSEEVRAVLEGTEINPLIAAPGANKWIKVRDVNVGYKEVAPLSRDAGLDVYYAGGNVAAADTVIDTNGISDGDICGIVSLRSSNTPRADVENKAIVLRGRVTSSVTALTVVTPGTGYQVNDVVGVDLGGAVATVSAIGDGGSVVSVTITGDNAYPVGHESTDAAPPEGGTACTLRVSAVDKTFTGDFSCAGAIEYTVLDLPVV